MAQCRGQRLCPDPRRIGVDVGTGAVSVGIVGPFCDLFVCEWVHRWGGCVDCAVIGHGAHGGTGVFAMGGVAGLSAFGRVGRGCIFAGGARHRMAVWQFCWNLWIDWCLFVYQLGRIARRPWPAGAGLYLDCHADGRAAVIWYVLWGKFHMDRGFGGVCCWIWAVVFCGPWGIASHFGSHSARLIGLNGGGAGWISGSADQTRPRRVRWLHRPPRLRLANQSFQGYGQERSWYSPWPVLKSPITQHP